MIRIFNPFHKEISYEFYMNLDDKISLVFGILTVIIAFIAGMIMGR
jgi:hypothetical protein